MQDFVQLLSVLTRSTPRFRGKGRVYRAFTRLALKSRHFDPVVTARFRDGTHMLVDLRSQTEVGAYYEGAYDKFHVDAICSLLTADSVVLDVGANVGFYTVPLCRRLANLGGTGRVVAFEPIQSNRARLEKNLAMNGLTARCSICELGLSDETRDVQITLREDFQHGAQTGNASIAISAEVDAGFERLPIRVDTLDRVWAERKGDAVIDLIKLDIEGHEDFFLRGAARTLANERPALFMEVNKPYYLARGSDVDALVLPAIPKDYAIYAHTHNGWTQAPDFSRCDNIDNVFLVPRERLDQPAYRRLFSPA